MNSFSTKPLTVQVLTISRADRWQVQQRLQSLSIPCDCSADGHLYVEVANPTTMLQIRSVIQQLTASRKELLTWLKQCWQAN